MKKYLCLKDLVMKGTGDIELTAGRLYSIIDYGVIDNSGAPHYSVDKFGIEVETVEIDGEEWIAGRLEMSGKEREIMGKWYFDSRIDYRGTLLRVVSTGEAEQEAESVSPKYLGWDMEDCGSFTIPSSDHFTININSHLNDMRVSSPQEAAYEAKQREKALDELTALSADEYRVFPEIHIDEFPVMLGGKYGA